MPAATITALGASGTATPARFRASGEPDSTSSAVPQPGDVIRARWQQSGTSLRVRASFYDASTATWHTDVFDTTSL